MLKCQAPVGLPRRDPRCSWGVTCGRRGPPDRADGVSGGSLSPSSRYEVLPQSFRTSFGAVANAELALRFFQVTADCLLAKIQCLSNITGLCSFRNQSQYRQFPRSQTNT